MNSEMGFSSKLRGLTAPVKCLSDDPRGTRHRARNIAPRTSHEGSTVKRLFFGFLCQFFVRSGKGRSYPVACDQIPGARGRGQGTETLAQLWRLAALASLVFRSALTPEHAEGR
jgi:hypothetical protein